MTAGNGKPCEKCGTSVWYKGGDCVQCTLARGKKRYEKHSEQVNQNSRKWHMANPEKVNEKSRKYREANREKTREANRRWTKNNPDKDKARVDKRRAKKAGNGGSHTAAEFQALCNQYDNRCLRCGRDDAKLEFDHVLPIAMGGSSNIDNGQPLCRSCNSWKKDKHIDYRTKPGILRWIQKKLFD